MMVVLELQTAALHFTLAKVIGQRYAGGNCSGVALEIPRRMSSAWTRAAKACGGRSRGDGLSIARRYIDRYQYTYDRDYNVLTRVNGALPYGRVSDLRLGLWGRVLMGRVVEISYVKSSHKLE
jgi:hypothetical protein